MRKYQSQLMAIIYNGNNMARTKLSMTKVSNNFDFRIILGQFFLDICHTYNPSYLIAIFHSGRVTFFNLR